MQKLYINPACRKSRISKYIYGHFSEHLGRCIYNGIYVGEESPIPNVKGMRADVVEALKRIRVPVLRWPGGCFADEYHWKDGIGPRETRKRMVNTHWGGVVEDNSFGTHEFMELCAQIGCEPYINGNVGSGTVREMSEWMEYLTFDGESPMSALRAENGRQAPWKVKFFGVGNESWGCGGNMRPEYYADLFRQYQTYLRNYGENKVFRIACGPNEDDYNWTETLMKQAGKYMDGLTMHYYTIPTGSWADKGSATGFTAEEYRETLRRALRMEEMVSGHARVMDRYDPEGRVGLIVDEWGAWYNVEPGTNPGFLYQQNTMRDAMVAALTLNIFNKHSDRVRMANLAQTVNVLQSVILTEGEKMLLTPTYHVFDLYKGHQENTLVESFLEAGEAEGLPALHESVSVGEDGRLHITLANLSAEEETPVRVLLADRKPVSAAARLLCGEMAARNTFEEPEAVGIQAFDKIRLREDGFELTMPACSVMEITVEADEAL